MKTILSTLLLAALAAMLLALTSAHPLACAQPADDDPAPADVEPIPPPPPDPPPPAAAPAPAPGGLPAFPSPPDRAEVLRKLQEQLRARGLTNQANSLTNPVMRGLTNPAAATATPVPPRATPFTPAAPAGRPPAAVVPAAPGGARPAPPVAGAVPPGGAAAGAGAGAGEAAAPVIKPGATNEPAEDIIAAGTIKFQDVDAMAVLEVYQELTGRTVLRPSSLPATKINIKTATDLTRREAVLALDSILSMNGITMIPQGEKFVKAVPQAQANQEANKFYTGSADELPEAGVLVKIIKGNGSSVGSGELIATTTLGAEVGYVVMWLIIFSCLIKAVIQAFLGRYTIVRGETGLAAFNRIPGRLWKVNWVLWAWALMVFFTLFQICAMFIGVSQAMNLLVADIGVTWWVLGFFVLTLVLLLGGAYKRIEGIAMIKVGLFTLITLLAAVTLVVWLAPTEVSHCQSWLPSTLKNTAPE